MGRYLFVVVSVLAWAGVGIDCVIDILHDKGYTALGMIAVLAPILAAIQWHSEKTERALRAHAGPAFPQRSDVNHLADTIDQAVKQAAEQAAAELSLSPVDTGPFPSLDRWSMR